MQNLTRAHHELFTRSPDECFADFDALCRHCQQAKDDSTVRWHPPHQLRVSPQREHLSLEIQDEGTLALSDWSFSQLCALAGVNRETVNRLSAVTAGQVFEETLPSTGKPLQLLAAVDTDGQTETVRAIHRASYTRLYDADLLTMLREFATDFQPPQAAGFAAGGAPLPGKVIARQADSSIQAGDTAIETPRGGTGLYRGEQDMFVFLIDPTGWVEIEGEAFAPGFFLWNSEVGRRSVGIQTFWFQALCANHIVWDAVEVAQFSRKHTANVHDAFAEIRRIVERLVEQRDRRRDGFARLIRRAMAAALPDEAEKDQRLLSQRGIPRHLARDALALARRSGRFTLFSLIDALTRASQLLRFAGDRSQADLRAAALLSAA